MYITISPQKSGGRFALSVSDYVGYLQKENEALPENVHEHFFSHWEDKIAPEKVIQDIDGNTVKLSLKEPRFYAITISPSRSELNALTKPSEDLRAYTRKVMEAYTRCFNREIDGRPIRTSDILYYAKVEHTRHFKGTDLEVRQNQTIATQILEVTHEMRRIERGQQAGDIARLAKEVARLEALAPAQLGGKRIREGMEKPGPQSHIHIIVSRKDASNRVSLSPGSKYKASEVEFAGKTVKRGFDRDQFFGRAEKVFDAQFGYRRDFAEKYRSRKLLSQKPEHFFKALVGLPASEKAAALKALGLTGAKLPHVATHPPSLTIKAAKRLRKSLEKALSSASIQI